MAEDVGPAPHRADRANDRGTLALIAADKKVYDPGADVKTVEDDVSDQHKSNDHEPNGFHFPFLLSSRPIRLQP